MSINVTRESFGGFIEIQRTLVEMGGNEASNGVLIRRFEFQVQLKVLVNFRSLKASDFLILNSV
jgi:hypothetical protein